MQWRVAAQRAAADALQKRKEKKCAAPAIIIINNCPPATTPLEKMAKKTTGRRLARELEALVSSLFLFNLSRLSSMVSMCEHV